MKKNRWTVGVKNKFYTDRNKTQDGMDLEVGMAFTIPQGGTAEILQEDRSYSVTFKPKVADAITEWARREGVGQEAIIKNAVAVGLTQLAKARKKSSKSESPYLP